MKTRRIFALVCIALIVCIACVAQGTDAGHLAWIAPALPVLLFTLAPATFAGFCPEPAWVELRPFSAPHGSRAPPVA